MCVDVAVNCSEKFQQAVGGGRKVPQISSSTEFMTISKRFDGIFCAFAACFGLLLTELSPGWSADFFQESFTPRLPGTGSSQ